MFEKYDVNYKGVPGGGGEYEVQLGFGWTNGVVLDLIAKAGADFTPSSSTTLQNAPQNVVNNDV